MTIASGNHVRWVAAALGGAVTVATIALLFGVPHVSLAPRSGRALPPITLSPGTTDELAMRDLAPLFLPTPFNAEPRVLPTLEPGRKFFEKDPGLRWHFNEDSPALTLPETVTLPGAPAQAVSRMPQPVGSGFGRTDAPVPVEPARGGHVDVFAANGRASVLALALDPAAAPTASGRKVTTWKPVELLATVDEAGLVGPLLVTATSGIEEVDAHFRNYLAGAFHLGDRLPPGFYRVVVGP